MILFILLLCGILFLGSSFTSLFKCKLSWWERYGLAYGLGLGIFTLGTFLSSLVGAPFNKYTLVVVFLALSGAIWGTKGKAIFSLGNIQAVKDYGAQSYYPLNIPIAMAIFYHFGESFVKSIFPFYFIAILMVFYGSLKRFGCGYVELAGTLMLAVTPFVFFHSTIAYANLPMAGPYFLSCSYSNLCSSLERFC